MHIHISAALRKILYTFSIAVTSTMLLFTTGCVSSSTNSVITNSNQSSTNTIVNMSTSNNFSSGLQIPVTDTTTFTTTASGLRYKDLTAGTGTTVAKVGDNVSVDYVGMLPDGTKFDSSLDRGQPFSFTLGIGQVIKGWDEGVAGLAIGQERILVIPAALGYGATGAGNSIPPNSTLQFEVRLNAIQ